MRQTLLAKAVLEAGGRPEQEEIPTPAAKPFRTITCPEHGKIMYEGHVACSACGNLYHAEDPESDRRAPAKCPCGHRLMPVTDNNQLSFTAMTCCPVCWKREVERFNKESQS